MQVVPPYFGPHLPSVLIGAVVGFVILVVVPVLDKPGSGTSLQVPKMG
jgi:hypothetical protein